MNMPVVANGDHGHRHAWTSWLLSRWVLALPHLVAAGLLLAVSDSWLAQVTAVALVLDVAIFLAPWRLPRTERRPWSYWAETLAYAVPLAAVAAWWLVTNAGDASAHLPSVGWWLVGLAVGAGLVIVSPVKLRAVISGDLAFLAGPLPPYRYFARLFSFVSAPVAEELIFRGVPAATASVPLLLVAGLAFVCRHHLVSGE